jgi:hypothetical protein
VGRWFCVAIIDPDCLAPGTPARFNFPPAISDHVTLAHLNPVFALSAKQQAGLRFSAGACISIVVITDIKAVERQ